MSGKPVVFVSSTIHDFRDLRTAIRYYLEELGYEVLLSEYNDFPKPLDENAYEACLATIERADYYILLIGSRVGALYDAANKISITRMEYRKAYKLASSGKLRIIAFLRDELWKVKTDREALLKFLESENGRWDLSEGDRQRIADHPSPLLDDAKTIFGFIKSLRWIPPSLLGGGKRRFAEGEPGCCLYELHELCQEQTSQRRRQAPTLRKNGCSVAPCVRRYLWRDTALHQTAT